MQSLSDNERKTVLGEVLHDQLQVIIEYVSDIPVIKKDIRILKSDVGVLKTDVKIIKAVVTDISKEQRDDARRIARLEKNVAI